MCEPKSKVALLGSAFFLGWSCTLLWLPRLGDIYGRKMPFALNQIINTILYSLLLWTRDLNQMIAILFTFGLVNSIRTNVGYVYMIELMPKRHETTIGTFWNCIEGLIFLQATIYFYYINKDWYYFVLIGYGL